MSMMIVCTVCNEISWADGEEMPPEHCPGCGANLDQQSMPSYSTAPRSEYEEVILDDDED